MSETNENALGPTARAALDALRRCSLTDLNRIELYHFRRVKNEVALRTAAECKAKAGLPVPAAETFDLHADDDEPDDDAATPLEITDPQS